MTFKPSDELIAAAHMEACRNSFEVFAQRAFRILEPGIPFEWNWHIGCFPYEQPVLTRNGYRPIGELVETNFVGEVLSYNHKTNKTEWKKVTHLFKNVGRPLYDMISSTGEQVVLTDNHPVWANGKYIEASKIKDGDRILRALPVGFHESALEQNPLLRNEMLWPSEKRPVKNDMPNVWRTKTLQWKSLQKVQRSILQKWPRASVRSLRQAYLQISFRFSLLYQNFWSFLQLQVPRIACKRIEQPQLYGWSVPATIPPYIQIGEKENHSTGWRGLFSLPGKTKEAIGCSSHRSRSKQQRAVESCFPVSPVSQYAEAGASRNIETSECYVKSIKPSLRISETVYNIEVADNNNYFANGILVHNCIAEHLQASFRGEIPELIMNIPPRFLKSVLVAQLYPAWVLGREPHHQFIGASYAHTLAERNVVKARQVMQDEFYRSLFPDTAISTDQNTKDYFTTTKAGQYKGTGIGGTLTGFGATSLILDDVLNPKEGMSDTIRANTNDEIRSTLFSRFNDRRNRRFIMIMQRIHDDDPTGNLIRDGGYHLVKLPAEAHHRVVIDLGKKQWVMEPGQLLDPKRVPKSELLKIRTDLGEANYVAQYLQEPAPLGGGEFRVEWLQFYQQGGIKPKDMNIVILVDPSGGDSVNKKRGKLSDWTAMIVIGLAPDRNYYILDIIRDRLNPTDRVNTLFTLHKKWAGLTGKSPKVGYEKYGMMTDTHYIQNKQRDEGYNFPMIELGGAMQKEERIRRMIPDMQNGRWWMPATLPYIDSEGRRFDLIEEFKSELATFPRSRFDDMSDSASRVYEEDLMLSFPKLRATMTQKAVSGASLSRTDNWEDW